MSARYSAQGRDGQTYEEVDRLDNVQEDLVLAVANTLGAPRNCVGDRHRWPHLHLELVRFLSDVSAPRKGNSVSSNSRRSTEISYSLLQNLALRRLRVSKVHHLIQQLVLSASKEGRGVSNSYLPCIAQRSREKRTIMTKLSRIDSSSSSLKYSVRTCRGCRSAGAPDQRASARMLTETSLCRKVRSSAAFEFFFVSATTVHRQRKSVSSARRARTRRGGGT